MRIRARRVLAQARQQWMGALALFLVLTGGVAYAADTVGSPDVINESLLSEDLKNNEVKTSDLAQNSVQTGKIGNDQVFSEDVRDDTLPNGGLTAADLASDSVRSTEVDDSTLRGDDLATNTVGVEELQGAKSFDAREVRVNDTDSPPGAVDVTLIDTGEYQIIGRCLENSPGTFTATIVAKRVGATPMTSAVDSTAPNGVNNVTNLAHGAEATLVRVGATTFTTFHTGEYAITGTTGEGTSGNVAAATKFGNTECRFQATAHGGGFDPE